MTPKCHTMATLTKPILRFISVFSIIVLFSNCSKDSVTQPQPGIIASENSQSSEKIYNHVVWELYGAWDYAYEAHIPDANVGSGSGCGGRLTVQVWDDQLNDWSTSDRYKWYLHQDEIHVVNPSFDAAIRGTYTRIRVIH